MEPRFRHPRPAKPEIVVIADISGSVASFARFTLHLVYAIQSQFSKVRSFVFVDGIDEVTRFFEKADDPADAVQRINTEADVVWVDGHSDYGHALGVFYDRWDKEITQRTSVLVLGDARNNYHADRGLGAGRAAQAGPPRLLAQPRAHATTGDRATRSSRPTARTATRSSSAGLCASWRSSSATWTEAPEGQSSGRSRSSSVTRKARSSAWRALRRGSHVVV